MSAEVVKAAAALCKYGITNKECDTELSAALGDPIVVISSMNLALKAHFSDKMFTAEYQDADG